ncbi:MAG: hypothetical protein JSR46_02665 [Verrucomicrobia bacterium]|nr:hypothetical protein [Verrucomicrobiota bacterium]
MSSAVCENFSIIVEEAGKFMLRVAEEGYKALKVGLDHAGRVFSNVDALRALSSAALTFIRLNEINAVAVEGFAHLIQTLKSVKEFLGARTFIIRLNELVTTDILWRNVQNHFPNLVKLASRLSLLVSDFIFAEGYAEKMGLVAQGVGNTATTSLFNLGANEAGNIFGYVGVSLELAENIAIAHQKGLDFDKGVAVVGSLAKVVSVTLGTPEDHFQLMVKIAAEATASLAYFVKFMKGDGG